MLTYIYKADIYCKKCGEDIREDLKAEGKVPALMNLNDEFSFDSDDFPKGPYEANHDAADYPQHCGNCGVFLENALTEDGIAYVREAIAKDTGKCIEEWREFYADML